MSNHIFNISVIIPCFNASRYLGEAIESVLYQSFSPFELIIVDDGSTDNSLAISSAYQAHNVHIMHKSHSGIAATRNTGIMHAKGNYIAFLDADDLWETTKLEKQVAAFLAKPQIQALFCNMQQFISPDLSDSEKKRYSCPHFSQAGYHAGCLLISRAAFLQVGLFSEELKAGEFIEWYIRAKQQKISFDLVKETLMYRRIHGQNTVLSAHHDIHADYLKIIRMKFKSECISI